MTATGDYTNQVHLSASPERVFEILTTAAEFTAWWAPAAGSAAEGGELRITFDGLDDPLVLRVRQRRNAEIRSPVTGHRSPHRRVRCPVPPSLTFGLRLA